MTPKQEYLAHDLDALTIEFCKNEAKKLEQEYPWTQEDTDRHAGITDYTCWLDLVLDIERSKAETRRGMYCAEMEE